ncbi:MAG: ribbon-helix-helix protein, CopG family [Chloroflexi bacterium]|nr:ribbon-helix-helix protein, CopG family [Chloroflexota bacterium]
MPKSKIAVTLDEKTVAELDSFIENQVFPSRSRAIEDALKEKLERLKATRLAVECAKLDPEEEKAMAEEGLAQDALEWPAY